MRKSMVIAVLVSGLSGCSINKVEPGHVGIKVSLTGSNKGVGPAELPPGYYFLTPTEELFKFPTFEQNYTWTKDIHEGTPVDESFTFQTREGLSVNTDVGINYHITPGKVSLVFQKYRRGMDDITHVFLRNSVRDGLNDVASRMPVESVYGEGKARLMVDVEKKVKEEMAPIGIEVSKLFIVGEFRLPAPVVEQLNAKIAATQKAQQVENELRQAEAEAKKQVATAEGEAKKNVALAEGQARAILSVAEAQAKANRLLAESLTSTLVEYKKAEKWNGQLPTVQSGGGTLLQLGVPGK